MALPAGARILELGCGPGDFWNHNPPRIPPGWQVTLSDFSEGMLAQAQAVVGPIFPSFDFRVIDAQSIPYPDAAFDGLIANHMLYHVPDRPRALAEIRRVLRPGGTLYATTVGDMHLREIGALTGRFDPSLAAASWPYTLGFTLENGPAQVQAFFPEVRVLRYPDALRVTDPAILADYMLSTTALGSEDPRRPDLIAFLREEMERNGGELAITKEAGMVVGR